LTDETQVNGDAMMLRTKSTRIETRAGEPVTLRGVGLGGWMNMENFITGYPSTESLQRKVLLKALGEEGYRRFFDRFLDVFFADEDAALLAELGLNCVRIPVNYRHFEDDMAPFELKENGFLLLDRAIERCARHGLYSVIDLHALPGCQNQHWHSDNPTHWAFFWAHRHFQDRVVYLWQALARRYRGNPWVAGYNPINEPGDAEGSNIWPFYKRLVDAVRTVDPDHILFLDGNRYSTEFGIFEDVWPNVVYTCHDYALPGFVDGGDYPGESRGQYVDRVGLEKTFLERTEFMRRTGTPIWVGEFGPVYTGDARRDEMRYRLLSDQLEIYRANEASWSLWTYKDIGLQGLVYAASDSPYLHRIEPVLEKKARLGVDAWGSTDEKVRDIMGPIEETFDREFPDFQPFPWGRESWMAVLVRHILLAEPLADDFGRCFEGVSDGEIEALADSFRLDRCVRREPLLDILRHASRGSATEMDG
jgi:endoglucanase